MTNLPDGDDSATPENAEAAEAAAQEAESRAAAARARARDLRRLAESEAAPKAEVLTATDDLIPTTRGRRVRWGALGLAAPFSPEISDSSGLASESVTAPLATTVTCSGR